MMEFKPNQNYNPKKRTYNENKNQNLMILFRRWHAFMLIPVVLLIHSGFIPFWVIPFPLVIIWAAAFLMFFGLLYIVFYYKIFWLNLTGYKNPILSSRKLLELFGHIALSMTLWHIGWLSSFCIYVIPIILSIVFYSILLGKQIADLQNKVL